MKINIDDKHVANFPSNTKPHVIGRTIARLVSPDGGKADVDAEEKARKQKEKEKDQLDETRHKEKIAVGLQSVKASQERNKSSAEHAKATREIPAALAKGLDAGSSKLAAELAGIKKGLESLSGLGKQLKELSECVEELGDKIEQGIKLVVSTMSKPKKLVRSERGALTGIRSDDE